MAKIMRFVMAFALCVVSVISRSVHRRKPREIVQKRSAVCKEVAKADFFSGIESEQPVSFLSN